MLASLFRKSTPLNYSIVILSVVFFFFIYQIKHATANNSWLHLGMKFGLICIIFASLFIANFIAKKNGLTKDSAYTVLFYLIFFLFFPSVFDDTALVLSNFFILLAMRRMLSLHSLKAPKEKIFDASLWVFVAALFHFWSILFIIMVFISILFHAARDYRNWFLPFIAFFGIAAVFGLSAMVFNKEWITHLLQHATVDMEFGYFTNNYQHLALSVYMTAGMLFTVLLLATLSNRPLILHSSYKKIIAAFFIGILILLVSPVKSNNQLIFTFAPVAIMATTFIEFTQTKWKKEVMLFALILSGVFAYFSQL